MVSVATLLFFGFVIGSGLLGAIGQAILAFTFAVGALAWLWFRMDHDRRRRLTLDVQHFLRPSSRS